MRLRNKDSEKEKEQKIDESDLEENEKNNILK